MEADDLQGQEDWVEATSDHAGERLIADRLEALEVERVIQRALELEASAGDGAQLISGDQLAKIAKEIGVDPAFVKEALDDVMLSPPTRSRFSKWVIPEDFFEKIRVSGLNREQLDNAIEKWMTQREGLTQSRVFTEGADWDVDRRWRARTRARTLSGDNRVSRVAGGDVAHRVHSISETEHLVALQAEGRWPLMFARLIMAVGGVFAAVLFLGAITSGETLLGFGVAVAIAAAATAIAVGGARWWARGIRGALSRSLIGLAAQVKDGSKGLFTQLREKRRERRRRKSDPTNDS